MQEYFYVNYYVQREKQLINDKCVVLVYLRVLHQKQSGRNKQMNKGSTLYWKTACEKRRRWKLRRNY